MHTRLLIGSFLAEHLHTSGLGSKRARCANVTPTNDTALRGVPAFATGGVTTFPIDACVRTGRAVRAHARVSWLVASARIAACAAPTRETRASTTPVSNLA